MKKMILAIALLAGATTFTATTTQAQVSVSFNIGSQPLWGPTGYDYAGYYYMPDVDAYYSIADQQFIYMDGGQWVYRQSLPGRYRNYDLYNGYKVVINEDRPWLRNNYYRRQYYGYRGRRGQGIIRDSRDYRYYEIQNHPYHNQWHGPRVDREGDRSNRRYDRRDRYYDRRDRRDRYDDRRRGSEGYIDRSQENQGVDREGRRQR